MWGFFTASQAKTELIYISHAKAEELMTLKRIGEARAAAIIKGRPYAREDERVQIAELLLAKRQVVRAVLLDDWKYLATWRALDPSERSGAHDRPAATAIDLWGTPVREELYDLGSDPGERREVGAAEAHEREALASALATFRSTGPNYGFADDPPAERAVSETDAERLRALGYVE